MLWLLLISWIIVITYWIWFSISFRKTKEHKIHAKKTKAGVTVIVCYKNEAGHITQTIRAILEQNYPLFEVIAMNDFSTDGSRELVHAINDPRFRCYDVKEEKPGKKQAVTEAVALAQYSHLLFTDADCVPSSKKWVQHMMEGCGNWRQSEIVLGFAPLIRHDGLLSQFQRYETVLTAIQYVSYAVSGIPYMGVGRNLMYTKEIFRKTGGMAGLMEVTSGDDDLLVSKMSGYTNVSVVLNPESFVYSEGKKTWMDYFRQKSRHISTSLYYSTTHKVLLSVFALSQVGFYILLVAALAMHVVDFVVAATLLLTKWTLQQILQADIFRKLKYEAPAWYFPVVDTVMMVYYLIMPWITIFRDKKW